MGQIPTLPLRRRATMATFTRPCDASGSAPPRESITLETVSASCAFFSLLAVDLPTLGWRQASDKGTGPRVLDSIQPSAAPGDRPYAPRFPPLPNCGVAAQAFSE